MKIFYVLLSFIFCCLLLSCAEKENFPVPPFTIEGDWVNEYELYRQDYKRYFTFEKEYCYWFKRTEGYILKNDTFSFSEEPLYKFTIEDTSKYSLNLKPISSGTAWDGFYTDYPDSILRLKKILQKNDLNFKRIGFGSGPCYSVCPVMNLEIDSLGNMIFVGSATYSEEKNGFYTGKITDEQLALIIRKINNIEFRKKQMSFGLGIMDAQYFGLWFETDEGTYVISTVNHLNDVPFEIISLSRYLIELYKNVDLEKAPIKGFNENFQFPILRKEVKLTEDYFQ